MGLRCVGAVGVAALCGTALASPAFAYGGAVTNGDFSAPGTNGATPTDWTAVPLGADTTPYENTVNAYNASGTYPPPAPLPSGATWASEAYYDVGSTAGIDGAGGSQPITGLTQAQDPQVSFSVAQTYAPTPGNTAWAGSVFEVDFTSGGTNYVLRYYNPFTPVSGTYTGGPTSTATTAYVVGTTLTDKTWYTEPTRDLSNDINAAFGLSSYTVTSVEYGNLEDAVTVTSSPYPNETSYWTLISLSTGPGTGTPEAPLAVALPAAAVVLFGGVVAYRRRHARTAETTSTI